MISIIMPVFNGEKYLSDAIDSIREQTYKDWELIIINDCSTDKTASIAEKMSVKDKRISVYSNKINQKLPRSLNIGFSLAKGDYYTWTSDDNIMKEYALEKMLAVLENDKTASLVYTCEEFINENNQIIGKRPHPHTLDDIYYHNILSACFLYKKEVHDLLGGYDVDKFLVEDYDFFLRAYRMCRFVYLKDICYQYRHHQESLTQTKKEEIVLKTIDLLKGIYVNESNEIIRGKINRGISDYYLELASIYCNRVLKESADTYDKNKIKLHAIKNLLRTVL